jgi:hypothetical protein
LGFADEAVLILQYANKNRRGTNEGASHCKDIQFRFCNLFNNYLTHIKKVKEPFLKIIKRFAEAIFNHQTFVSCQLNS